MKVKKKETMSGDWLDKNKDIKDGDKIKILNEGKVVSGDYGDRHVFQVETKNGEKLLSVNQTSLNTLIDAWGNETKNWVEKEVKVWVNRENVSGKMRLVVYITPPDWTVDEKGEFSAPGDKKDIPVINEEEGVPPEYGG